MTVKNPLCQTLSAAVMAHEPYQLGPTDDTWRREQLRSDAGQQDSVVVLADVRDLFDALRWRAYREVIPFHRDGDRAGFAARVRDIAEELAARGGVDVRTARTKAATVSAWTWRHHDPLKVAGRRQPGPCADLVRGLPLRVRQAIGGQWAAKKRRDKNVRKMAEAYNAIGFGRFAVSMAAVAKASGLSLSTVRRRWAEVVEMAKLLSSKQSPIYGSSIPGNEEFALGDRKNYPSAAENHVRPTPFRADGTLKPTAAPPMNWQTPQSAAA
jgi:hypothetical protein